MTRVITANPRVMRGASAGTAGAAGYVPAGAAGDQDKLLHGDATWRAVSNASAASNAETIAGTSTTKFVTPASDAYALAARTNALALRGGVYVGAGTAGGIVKQGASSTAANLGTDGCSFVIVWKIDAYTGNTFIGGFSDDASGFASNNRIALVVENVGSNQKLQVVCNKAGVQVLSDVRTGAEAAALLGKWNISTVTRSGTTLKFYNDGVLLTTVTNASADVNLATTYFHRGAYIAGNGGMGGYLGPATPYNLTLSDADVAEIAAMGGGVPRRYDCGSQVSKLTGTDSDFSGAGNWTQSGSATLSIGSGVATISIPASGGSDAINSPTLSTLGMSSESNILRQYRFRCTISNATGSGPVRMEQSWNGAVLGSFTATNGVKEIMFVNAAPNGAGRFKFYVNYTGPETTTGFDMDSATIVPLGAYAHYPSDEGIGFQLHDVFANKIDQTVTTTGVSHIAPRDRGYVRGTLTWAGTHEGKSLIGQPALPSNAVLTLATIKPTATHSGTGAQVGDFTTPNRFVTTTSYTTAKKVLTFANQLPAGTSDNERHIALDPSDTNYTGSIELEVHYTATSGNP